LIDYTTDRETYLIVQVFGKLQWSPETAIETFYLFVNLLRGQPATLSLNIGFTYCYDIIISLKINTKWRLSNKRQLLKTFGHIFI